jgi:hypothetical protein
MSEKLSIKDIQTEFNELCQKIKPSDSVYTFPTVRQDDGFEHLEVCGDEYHLVVTERGLENSRQITRSKDELLYWLVSSFVWGLASKFELQNRIPEQDFRRLFFAKQIEYLKMADPRWANRKQMEFDEILTRHPFNDTL